MFIEPNKPVTVDELLRGMIVQSGNDATMALAEGVAGSEEAFVQRDERAGGAPRADADADSPTLPDCPIHITTPPPVICRCSPSR